MTIWDNIKDSKDAYDKLKDANDNFQEYLRAKALCDGNPDNAAACFANWQGSGFAYLLIKLQNWVENLLNSQTSKACP